MISLFDFANLYLLKIIQACVTGMTAVTTQENAVNIVVTADKIKVNLYSFIVLDLSFD